MVCCLTLEMVYTSGGWWTNPYAVLVDLGDGLHFRVAGGPIHMLCFLTLEMVYTSGGMVNAWSG